MDETVAAAGQTWEDTDGGEVIRLLGRHESGTWRVERLRSAAHPNATPGERLRDLSRFRPVNVPTWRDPDGCLVDGRWMPEGR